MEVDPLLRATGIAAYAFLSLSMLLGPMLRWPLPAQLRWLKKMHNPLALAGIVAMVAHLGYLLVSPLMFLVPHRLAAAPGAIALIWYGGIYTSSKLWQAKQLTAKTWRKLHQLAWVGYVALVLHAVMAGPDNLLTVYVVVTLAIGGVLLVAHYPKGKTYAIHLSSGARALYERYAAKWHSPSGHD